MKKRKVHPMPTIKMIDSEHVEFDGKVIKFAGNTADGDFVFEGVADGLVVFKALKFRVADYYPKGRLTRR